MPCLLTGWEQGATLRGYWMQYLREIFGDPVHRALAFNSGWLLADRMVRMAMGLLVGVWVARYLGPADYGLLNIAIAFAAFFLPFASLGLEKVTVRELTRDGPGGPVILGSALVMKGLGGLVGVGLAGVIGLALGLEASRLLLALVLLANLLAAFDVIDYGLQSIERFDLTVKARGAAFLVCSAGKLALIGLGASVTAFGGMVLIEAVLAASLLAWALRFTPLGGERWHFGRATARRLIGDSWPVLATEFAVLLLQRADLLLLGWLAGEREAGVYSAAQRIAQLSFFIPPIAGKLTFPRLARETDPGRAKAIAQQLMNRLVAAGYVITGLILLLHAQLIHVLFGAKYAGAGVMLCWLAGCTVFVFMGCVHSLYLVSRNRQAVTLRLAWLTAGTSIALNLWLVPMYQGVGAALAVLTAYALTTTFGVALYRESREMLRMNLTALVWPVQLLLARFGAANRR